MKVLMVTGDFPPAITGVGDYTRRLVDALGSLDVDVEVLAGPGAVRDTVRALDRLGPGPLIHIQYPGLAYGRRPAINLLPALLKLLRPRCRVVVTMHEFRAMRGRWRVRALPMLLAADAIVLVDPLDRPMVRRWTGRSESRIVCIPIGPNIVPEPMTDAEVVAWRSRLGLPGPEPIVVFFGGVYEHKGVLELISAVQGLRERGLGARLLLVGEPDPGGQFQERVEGLLKEATAQGWSRWMRSVPPDIVSRYLQAADVAALPFHSGAMANRGSLLVALAHGLPAVTTRSPATPPCFGPDTGMALVRPGCAAELQGCLEEMLRSPSRRSTLRDAARAYAQGFSWEVIAGSTRDLYRSLLPAPAS